MLKKKPQSCAADVLCDAPVKLRGLCQYHYETQIEPLRRDADACRHAHAALLIAADRRQSGWWSMYVAQTMSRFLCKFADSLEVEAEGLAADKG